MRSIRLPTREGRLESFANEGVPWPTVRACCAIPISRGTGWLGSSRSTGWTRECR